MRCAACGLGNPPGFPSCAACGASLTARCVACAATLPPAARYCSRCGTAVDDGLDDDEHGIAETQRRLVTVLFADLVGYTAYAEERDPEEVREFLSDYFETVRATIASYGGRVEKFIGDAVMAVWGAPAAHEDDAERAVRAGLDLHAAVALLGRRIGAELRIRSGVATGEAAVTRGLIGQGMVAGDVVNIAARLQAAAEPGTLLAESVTHRAARLSIAFDPVGPMAFRNKRRPVTAWRATRVVAGRRGEGRANQLEPPFVGRTSERQALYERFSEAVRDRRPHMVTVLGAAGTGKSRLAWELEKHLDGLALQTHWHRATSPAYGPRLAYAALAEMVRQRADIPPDLPRAAARRRLRECIANLTTDESEARRIDRALRLLLGLSHRGVESRDELFAGWHAFFAALAAKRPTVLVFDDTQLADDALLDFIDGPVEWPRGGPLLVVVLARPDLLARRPALGSTGRSRSIIDLAPLPHRAMGRLLESIAPQLPRMVAERIRERAQGIPLYAVELLRMLADRGELEVRDGVYVPLGSVGDAGLPETIHALLAARLDELGDDDRSVVNDAAVIGTRFSTNALAAVGGRPRGRLAPVLDRLAAAQLIVRDSRPRHDGLATYRFADVAMQEVAYATLSRRDRRARHLAAASYHEAIEDPGQSAVVASHLLAAHRADEREPDAADVARRAVRALRRAASHAMELHAPEQALRHLEDALSIVAAAEVRAELWELAAAAAESAARHEQAERFLRLAIRHHRRARAERRVVRLTARLGGVLLMRYQVGAALRLLRSAAGPQIAAAGADDPELVTVMARLARAYSLREERAAALEWSSRALAAARRHRLPGETAEALMTMGAELAFSGPMRRGLAIMRRAVTTADRFDLAVAGVRARVNLAAVLLYSDPALALEEARGALGLARTLGLRDLAVRALSVGAGDAALDAGEWSWAAAALDEIEPDGLSLPDVVDFESARQLIAAWRGDERAEAALEARAARLDASERLASAIVAYRMASASLATGDPDAAREHAERAVALLGAEAYHFAALSLGWSVLARAATWQGDAAGVREALAAFEARPLDSRWWAATCATMRAGILALDGDRSAGRAYAAALRRWTSLRLPLRVGLVRLDQAYAMGGDGKAALKAARATFDALGADRFVATIDHRLGSRRVA